MKYLSILTACVAVTHAYYVVVCVPRDGAEIGDVEWAIQNRRHDLALGGKGFWRGHSTSCHRNANAVVDVVALCRSDPYIGAHPTVLKYGASVLCQASGAPDWPTCTVNC
ncbi:uncharacterized protein RCO7_12002 [Rhynchosporium graminicola]|uniref:Necrosis-inducing peptide 2 n=2 Tax=Rhynchosporium TaxID=38037 RepID=A0A6S4FT01_RHYSE|nr:necrosis-inducing peptide 2 [Rhynchosporium secalis]AFI43935.1 necrosis-inducing peptide 2 [Rhynchosporium commune]AAV53599.1 necrosis-inducing peptide 2 [Rhynchosporium secalis]AAV53600.1 necrosis-inducing peptide 2 [Rhynchosporium secalis]AAV53601.1 necrosis-inducing peptide 2 [Rhynchosporium secalis]